MLGIFYNLKTQLHSSGKVYTCSVTDNCRRFVFISLKYTSQRSIKMKKPRYRCTCTRYDLINVCVIDFNACISSPCQNNGECEPDSQGFDCSCPKGYIGPTCNRMYCSILPDVSCTFHQKTRVCRFGICFTFHRNMHARMHAHLHFYVKVSIGECYMRDDCFIRIAGK